MSGVFAGPVTGELGGCGVLAGFGVVETGVPGGCGVVEAGVAEAGVPDGCGVVEAGVVDVSGVPELDVFAVSGVVADRGLL